jgi:hypothetical protein
MTGRKYLSRSSPISGADHLKSFCFWIRTSSRKQKISFQANENLTAISNTRPVLLRVTRANFEDGKWGFSDGNAKFNAIIKDAGFRDKLDSGQEGFYKGDVLRVELTTTQTVDASGNFKSEYRIDKVIEHIHPWLQQPLITDAPTPEGLRFPKHDPKRLSPSRE